MSIQVRKLFISETKGICKSVLWWYVPWKKIFETDYNSNRTILTIITTLVEYFREIWIEIVIHDCCYIRKAKTYDLVKEMTKWWVWALVLDLSLSYLVCQWMGRKLSRRSFFQDGGWEKILRTGDINMKQSLSLRRCLWSTVRTKYDNGIHFHYDEDDT